VAGAKQLAGISVLLVAGRKHTCPSGGFSTGWARVHVSYCGANASIALTKGVDAFATLDDELSTAYKFVELLVDRRVWVWAPLITMRCLVVCGKGTRSLAAGGDRSNQIIIIFRFISFCRRNILQWVHGMMHSPRVTLPAAFEVAEIDNLALLIGTSNRSVSVH
jgi:hypothetical protein